MHTVNNRYENRVGLVLYSGNPFAISKIHEIVDDIKGDRLRREIILTKYIYSTMSEVQQEVFKRLAEGTFEICRETECAEPEYIEMVNDLVIERKNGKPHPVIRRVPVSSETWTWFAIDKKNNVAFRCKPDSVHVEVNKLPEDVDYSPSVLITDNIQISKMFYWLCESLHVKNTQNKIQSVQAVYELNETILELYKR